MMNDAVDGSLKGVYVQDWDGNQRPDVEAIQLWLVVQGVAYVKMHLRTLRQVLC